MSEIKKPTMPSDKDFIDFCYGHGWDEDDTQYDIALLTRAWMHEFIYPDYQASKACEARLQEKCAEYNKEISFKSEVVNILQEKLTASEAGAQALEADLSRAMYGF